MLQFIFLMNRVFHILMQPYVIRKTVLDYSRLHIFKSEVATICILNADRFTGMKNREISLIFISILE